jgi:hypothetical protein
MGNTQSDVKLLAADRGSPKALKLYEDIVATQIALLKNTNGVEPIVTKKDEFNTLLSYPDNRFQRKIINSTIVDKTNKICDRKFHKDEIKENINLRILDYCVGKNKEGKEVIKFNHNLHRTDVRDYIHHEYDAIPWADIDFKPSDNVLSNEKITSSEQKTPKEILDSLVANVAALSKVNGSKFERIATDSELLAHLIVTTTDPTPGLGLNRVQHIHLDAETAKYNTDICSIPYSDYVSIRDSYTLNVFCDDVEQDHIDVNLTIEREDIGTTYSDVVPFVKTETVSKADFDKIFMDINPKKVYNRTQNRVRSTSSCFSYRCNQYELPSIVYLPQIIPTYVPTYIYPTYTPTTTVTIPYTTSSIIPNYVIPRNVIPQTVIPRNIIPTSTIVTPTITQPKVIVPTITPPRYYIKADTEEVAPKHIKYKIRRSNVNDVELDY